MSQDAVKKDDSAVEKDEGFEEFQNQIPDDNARSGCRGDLCFKKVVNMIFQLMPYTLQYVSLVMLVDVLVQYGCQDKGRFVVDSRMDTQRELASQWVQGAPAAAPLDWSMGEKYTMKRGMLNGGCTEGWSYTMMGVLCGVIVLMISYQIWAMFRQTRHVMWGTFAYMCYLEVAKEKGSWMMKGIYAQIVLNIIVAIAVLVVAIVVMVDQEASVDEVWSVIIEVGFRLAIGFGKIPELVMYDGPIQSKAHARLSWKALRGMTIDYGVMTLSQDLMRDLTSILCMDPITMEQVIIEATYMVQGEADFTTEVMNLGAVIEGSEADRARDVQVILEDGLEKRKLSRVKIDAYKTACGKLGGGLGHLNAALLGSIGKGDAEVQYCTSGIHGEECRPLIEWALRMGAGGHNFPLDKKARARSAQMRYRELLWYFRDPHARKGMVGGEEWYKGPAGVAAGGDGLDEDRALGDASPEFGSPAHPQPAAAEGTEPVAQGPKA